MDWRNATLDLGLLTKQPDALLPFRQKEVGLPFIPTGNGIESSQESH